MSVYQAIVNPYHENRWTDVRGTSAGRGLAPRRARAPQGTNMAVLVPPGNPIRDPTEVGHRGRIKGVARGR